MKHVLCNRSILAFKMINHREPEVTESWLFIITASQHLTVSVQA